MPGAPATVAGGRRDARRAVARPRVLVADAAPLWRDGVARLLGDAGVDVVARAGTVRELVEGVATSRPDVVVVDPALPSGGAGEDGGGAVLRLRRADPELAVLVLGGASAAPAAAVLGHGRGGIGLLDKHAVAAASDLARAVECVAMGGTPARPGVAPRPAESAAPGPLDALSRREREVLELIAEGASNAAIAEVLGIAGKTVDSHVGRILVKLGVGEDPAVNRRVTAALLHLRAAPGAAVRPAA